jgi:hypothetical protein
MEDFKIFNYNKMERQSSNNLETKKESQLEKLLRHMTKYKIIKTNLKCFCVSIFVLAIYFLIISILLTLFARKDFLYRIRFDDKCNSLNECDFVWKLDKNLEPPIYILFGFKDFYVNHRSIALSVNEKQLLGTSFEKVSQVKPTCGEHASTNGDLVGLGHADLDPEDEDYVLVNEVFTNT